jgi:hypothetical protein
MSYADGLLSSEERVVHREKQHWLVFIWGARWAVGAVLVAFLIFILRVNLSAQQQSEAIGTIMGWAALALVVGGLAVLTWHILRYISQEYVLTNRRVVQVAGVLNKTSLDSSLEKINDARLSQSVFGRIFGFGDLEILTAAETGVDRFRMIRDPIGFKKAMLDAKHEYEKDVAGGSYAPSPPMRSEPAPTAAPAPAQPAPAPAAPIASPPSQPLAGAVPVGDETVSGSVPGRPGPATLSSDELTRTLASLADLRDRGAISAEEYERKKTDLLTRL